MAVQKSRKTPSKRGMRRSHNALTSPALSEDQETAARSQPGMPLYQFVSVEFLRAAL